ncbi:T9SS type A sorting domain-containing protein [Mariniflexile sp. AS56]|uniref:T9SS type A sorting domain-containing protein n=1 Tax=Mariniflexile sp. AS56 TaxID=3063957 RepID=UPI0026EE3D8B|nr:T9SS type A sorting domain-containing protein [Mariniflexile sp. AS56]MDO7172458.1 T9SS type A sorting domain-containing protein [Mariniflexile sp. AS56]
MKSFLLIILLFVSFSFFSQEENKDILLIHAAQRDSQNGVFPSTGNETYYDQLIQMSNSDLTMEYIAEYLQGLLSLTDNYSDMQVDVNSEGYANSLVDIYYDPQFASVKSMIINGGYKYVIFFDSEQAYTYPEIMYEACKQFTQPILEAGGTPMLMMNYSSYVTDVNQLGEFTYRAANGNGIEVIPAGYAIDEAGLQGRKVGDERAEQAMISASAIYRKITDLDAADANYVPTYEHTNINPASQYTLSNTRITQLANYATTAVDTHKTVNHYSTSYENDGAVVYRNLNIASAPFNNEVKYFYKGTSTHDFTKDRLNTIIGNSFTATERKLSKQVFNTRDWTVDDTALRATLFAENADLGVFLYVGGSDPDADAQDIINSNQANMIPLVFDWIKGFDSASGITSTANALNNEVCAALWYNYHFRGWKTIPLTVGMGRLNETFSNFIASDDAIHISDPLVYMNASMMIASSMGTELPIPNNLPTRRGTWTQTQLETAIEIGHDLIKELAHMSETFNYVPDSDLLIGTKSIPKVVVNEAFSYQLIALGGTGNYTWELISSAPLPDGLSLSTDGVISGTATTNFEFQNVAFKVTDDVGAFRKVGLNLLSTLDALSITSIDNASDKNMFIYPNPINNKELNVLFTNKLINSIKLELYTCDGRRLIQKNYSSTEQHLKVNVINIPSGIYFLMIKTGNTINTEKIIIK